MNTTVLIFVIVTAGIVYGQSPPNRPAVNICTGFETDQLIPDYTNCRQFYRCDARGVPLLQSCVTGFNFDVVHEECRLANLVTCFKCPEDHYFVDLPIDRNCLQFVRCFADGATQQTCTDGLLFDPMHQQCNFEPKVTCGCPRREIASRPVFFRSRENCAQYRVCANGTEIHEQCQEGLHFNMQLHQCDHPNDDCTNASD